MCRAAAVQENRWLTCAWALAGRTARCTTPVDRDVASTRAVVSGSGLSGGTSQPFGAPATELTNDNGPPDAAATGRPQAMASTKTWPNASPTEGETKTSAQPSPAGRSSWPRHPVKNTPSIPSSRTTVTGCSPSHSPGKATRHQQRRPHPEVAPRPSVCPQQQRQPFREGEPADEDQHRLFRVVESSQVNVAVAHRPDHPRLVPPPRPVHQPGTHQPQTVGPGPSDGPEPLLVDARRLDHHPILGDAEYRHRPGGVGRGSHHQTVGGVRPSPQPGRPRGGMRQRRPTLTGARTVDGLEHR